MKTNAQVLDVRLDGSFVAPRTPSLPQITGRVIGFGILLLFAYALFKATVFLLPVVLALALFGALALRSQLRHRRVVVIQRRRY